MTVPLVVLESDRHPKEQHMHQIETRIKNGDRVLFTSIYGERLPGMVTEILSNDSLFISYGPGLRRLAIFSITENGVELACEQCFTPKHANPGKAVENPYEADVNNKPGVRIVSCDDCLRELTDDI